MPMSMMYYSVKLKNKLIKKETIKMNLKKMLLSAIAVSVIGTSQVLSASDEGKAETVIDTGTFEKWVLVDFELRKESDKYIKIENSTISISAKSSIKNIWFFNQTSIPCVNGGNVEFSFDAEGAGQGQIGFFAYADDKWTSTEGLKIIDFTTGKDKKNFKFSIPLKGEKIKAIRVLIGATPNSEVKFSDLKISVK